MKLSQVSIKNKANEVIRIDLSGYTVQADEGEISLDGQYVEIVSVESDSFKEIDLRLKREIAMGVNYDQQTLDATIKSALIVGWSFDEPCNEENKVLLFKTWPSPITNYIVKRAEGLGKVKFSTPILPSSANTQSANIGLQDQ